uniref:Uncharacterized protein n=1 Tax=Oryza meridionalis TaxID=40149 RepID=A0A0E0F2N8_9ORYZ
MRWSSSWEDRRTGTSSMTDAIEGKVAARESVGRREQRRWQRPTATTRVVETDGNDATAEGRRRQHARGDGGRRERAARSFVPEKEKGENGWAHAWGPQLARQFWLANFGQRGEEFG